MNARLHPALTPAMLAMVNPASIVHRIVAADRDYNELKNSGELERRRFEQAMRLQQTFQDATGVTL